ncbi:MAG TPA: TolC family protein [Spirochaetota bacterium]|nr:TolC family protein [Spirochaetota bacterium]
MRTKTLITIFIFISTILLMHLSMAQEIAQTKKISFKEYLEIIKGNLPELQRSSITIEKAEKSVLSSASSLDTTLSGSGNYSRSSKYNSATESSYYSKIWSANAALSKKLLSGTTLEAGTSYEYVTEDLKNTGYYRPALYVKFTQELLKNSFGTLDRFTVNDAKMKLEIEKLRKFETDKTYLNTYKKLYFNWIAQIKKLNLLKEYITNTEKLRTDIENKVKSGLADKTDLHSVDALLLQYRLNYKNAELKLDEIKAALLIFPEFSSAAPLEDDFAKTLQYVTLANFESVPYEKTRSAAIYRMTKENLLYSAEVQQNRLLPQLDISGQYTRLANSTESIKGYSKMNESEYYIGFGITYPIENTSAKVYLKEAEIAVKEINSEFEIAKNSHKTNLETTLKSIEGLKEIIDISEKRINVLEAKYRNIYRQYLQSRKDFQYLIDTSLAVTQQKIDLLELQNSLIQYSIDYEDLAEKI